MKKLLASIVILASLTAMAQAQTISADRVKAYNASHAPVTVNSNLKSVAVAVAPPASGNIVFATPGFGIGALTVTKTFNRWEATGTINPSFTYGVGVGEYTTNADGSLNNQPYVTANAFLAAGIIPQSIIQGSFQVGGALGIYKYANIAAGYDVLTKEPFVALGASVSLFTFKQGLGSTILKTF